MKIALFTDGIAPYVIGGMQKHSFYLAKFFAAKQVDVLLFHTSKDKVEAENLACFSADERKHITSYFIPFPTLNKFPGHYIRASYRYSKLMYEAFIKVNKQVDFVYAQGFCAWYYIEQKKKSKNLPTIGVNFHGLEMFQKSADIKTFLQTFLFKQPVLFNLQNADCVFSLGGKLTDILIQKGIEQKNIIQIPIGIDKQWLVQKDVLAKKDKLKFVFVGRYERRKGIEELTEVLKQIKNSNFEFHFIGNIPDDKKIKSNAITYHGSINDTEKIKSIIRACDVLVCPSYSEGMPTVILEAMASGLAIIASNVGAVGEQVSNENGILIGAGNKSELKNALLKIEKMPYSELYLLKQNSISKIANHFLWNNIIEKTIVEIEKRIH
jgi:glycosyltransferase involved in cell wall biosynthesis